MHETHIHTITVERGGQTIAARRVFHAARESNGVVTIPAGAKDVLIELPVPAEKVVAVHIGAKLRECPLDPVPAVSWARGDEGRCPLGFLTSNPSAEDVDVHVSCLHDA